MFISLEPHRSAVLRGGDKLLMEKHNFYRQASQQKGSKANRALCEYIGSEIVVVIGKTIKCCAQGGGEEGMICGFLCVVDHNY